MRVALTLFLIGACSIAAAPENLHQQRQNFQFSSSSKKYVNNELADENENSGYYRSQHGNVGGNYEESHNMDAEAQRQLEELKRLTEEMSQKSFTLDGSTSQQSAFRTFGGHSSRAFATGDLGQQTETFGGSYGLGYNAGGVGQQSESFGSGFGAERVGQRTESTGRLYGSGYRTSTLGQGTENFDRSRYSAGTTYNLRGGEQTGISGHNHHHSRFYGRHSHPGRLNSLGQKAEDCDEQHTDQFTSEVGQTSHGIGSYTETSTPLSRSNLNVGSLQRGSGHGQRRYYTTSYTSSVPAEVYRPHTHGHHTTHNAGDRYSEQSTDQLTQATQYYGRRPHDREQHIENYGQQTVDLGQQTEDFGQQTVDLGQQTEDFGQQTVDLGQQTEDFGQQTVDLGQQTQDFGQQTVDLGQQSEDFGQQTVDLGQQTENFGQQVQTTVITRPRKPTHTGHFNLEATSSTRYPSSRYPSQTVPITPVTTSTSRTNRTQHVSIVRTESKPLASSTTEIPMPDLEVDTADLRPTTRPVRPSLSVKPLEVDSLVNKPTQPVINLEAHMATLDKHMEELLKLSQHLQTDTSTTQVDYNAKPSYTRRPKPVYSQTSSKFDQHESDVGQQTQQNVFSSESSRNLEIEQQSSRKPNSGIYLQSKPDRIPSQTEKVKYLSEDDDLGQQTENLGQQTQHAFSQSQYTGKMEWNQATGSYSKPVSQKPSLQSEDSRYPAYLGQQTEDLGQQTQDFGQISEDLGQSTVDLGQQTHEFDFHSQHNGNLEWDQSSGSYRNPITPKSTFKPDTSRYPVHLGQQTEDLGQETQKFDFHSQQSGNLEWDQHSSSYGKPVTPKSALTPDISRHPLHLGQQTEDLGQQTEDLGQETQKFDFHSQQSGNLEWDQHSGSYRKPVTPKSILKPDISRHPAHLGQQTEDLGQQTEDLSQETQKFDFHSQQSGNLEWDQHADSYRKPVTPKSTFKPDTSRYPVYLGQQTEDLGQQTEDLGQQTQTIGFQSQQTGKLEWNQGTGSYNKPLSGQSLHQRGEHRYPTHLEKQIEDLGQQTEDLGQQSEDFGQQTQQGGFFNVGIDLGQQSSSSGQWSQNGESLTQQSSRDIINREKEGQLLVGNKFTNKPQSQYGTSHRVSQVTEHNSDGRENQHMGVIGLDQQTLIGLLSTPYSQNEGETRYQHSSHPQGQTTSGLSYNRHNQQLDSSRLQSASHSVRRGDQTMTHTSEEDKLSIGQTVEHSPSTSNLGNVQSFAISGSQTTNYGDDSQRLLGDIHGIVGVGSGKVSGSVSQASSSSSSYSHSASGSFIGKNRTGLISNGHLNSGDLRYGTQHQLGESFDQQTEDLQQQTLPNPAYGHRTEHGGYSTGSSANLGNQQTEDIGQQVGQFHFSSESSSSKHEEHQERSSFDIISGSGGSTNADLQMETMTPEEKRGFWGSLGQKAKNLAGKVRDSLG